MVGEMRVLVGGRGPGTAKTVDLDTSGGSRKQWG